MSLAIPADELERSKVHIQISHSGGNPVFRLEPLPATSSTADNRTPFNVNFEVSKEEAGYNLLVYPTPARTTHTSATNGSPHGSSGQQHPSGPRASQTSLAGSSDAPNYTVTDPLTGETTSRVQSSSRTSGSRTPCDLSSDVGQDNVMVRFDQMDMNGMFGDMFRNADLPGAFNSSSSNDLSSPELNFPFDPFQDDSSNFYFPPSDSFGFSQSYLGTRRESAVRLETLPSTTKHPPSSSSCLPSPTPSIPSPSPRLSPPLFTTAPEIPLGAKAKAALQEEKSTSKGLRRAGKRQYPCLHPTCSRFFTSEYTRQMHMATHETKARKAYPCSMGEGCQETFSRAHDRLRHEVAMHGKDCQWVCHNCERFFSSSRMLELHKCPVNDSNWVRPRHPVAIASSMSFIMQTIRYLY
ncbi:hypothetical protein NEOLEDRAFT_1183280 [Neolentinus lepideus HHB14362 ss-1]|uniref:C2H2-type domain-containing protein n=1 Tax=Neolentinus lepideus HHB14362 ss-1 TaxID=1314782 RepID=A0A165NFS0_9AGAM|nr:hypothetical protein NEOLEDRAFT_1183280 [Neolentinus lepideus HHB14362 ss-1]